jgi:alkylation response protein AidB-like acyl-CoA dehydrogenase
MNFNHSEDRQMLADTLGRFLADRYDFATRQRIAHSEKGFDHEIWGALADLGVLGALFDKSLGGFGGSGFDIAVVFESLGRALCVEPFLGALMAGTLIGDRAELVERVVAGTALITLAHFEPNGRYDPSDTMTRAMRNGEQWVLSGAKAVVPQLESADLICVSARITDDPAGISLFLVPATAPGVAIRGYGMIDGGRGGELGLCDVVLEADALMGGEGMAFPAIERAIASGVVALSAEAVGIMDVIKETTVDYLRTRKQFGIPIGKFQALQHRMASVLLEIEQARSAMTNAAAASSQDRRDRERAVSAAKYTIGRVGTLVAEEAIQLHGGIGMTWELALSHYAKRLIMIGHQLGDEDYHLERFIALGDAPLTTLAE